MRGEWGVQKLTILCNEKRQKELSHKSKRKKKDTIKEGFKEGFKRQTARLKKVLRQEPI